MTRRFGGILTLLLAFLLVPGAARAQASPAAGLRATPTQLQAIGRLHPVAAARAAPATNLSAAAYRHGSKKEGTALMIVGAAGIVTGLLVDESLITILGAGAGGLGLYLYLR